MEKIKIIFWGLGTVGSEMARMVLKKEGLEIVGVIDKDLSKKGKKLSEVLKGGHSGVIINDDPKEIIGKVNADIVVLSVGAVVKTVFSIVKFIIENKLNCISIAEEMAYPYLIEPELSQKMNGLAKENGVTILGTGVNPGFVLDALIIMLTASCKNIKSIKAIRISDLSSLGANFIKSQGVGTTIQEFEKDIERGIVTGHIGFAQSIPMIAKALGLKYNKIIESMEPIISNTYRETENVIVHPGMVAGCNHIATAYNDEKVVIELEHPQQIYPQSEGFDTGDYIDIYGDGNMHIHITPETPGLIGTAAIAINIIPQVIASKSGLKTMVDMPLPHVIENSFTDQLKYYLQ
ncbi:MAG: 2,4-diaminopentanoate dehydrogenase [Clostridium sp.]